MIVYLALGSNLGDRVGAIQQALRMLTDHDEIKVLSTSSFYETEPVNIDGAEGEPEWFVNAAVAIDTSLPPEDLLKLCQDIEKTLGRKRDTQHQHASRTIDIDILFYGELVMNEPDLIIPHPRLHQRAFMLVPMLEVNSRMVHPVFKKSIEQLHNDLADPEEVLLYGTRRSTLF